MPVVTSNYRALLKSGTSRNRDECLKGSGSFQIEKMQLGSPTETQKFGQTDVSLSTATGSSILLYTVPTLGNFPDRRVCPHSGCHKIKIFNTQFPSALLQYHDIDTARIEVRDKTRQMFMPVENYHLLLLLLLLFASSNDQQHGEQS